MTLYLLDTNVFINFKKTDYGLTKRPDFWTWLLAQNRAGKLASIIQVYRELAYYGDNLSEWARANSENLFLHPDKSVNLGHELLINWVTPRYKSDIVADFIRKADSWLIAHAPAKKCTVVSYETRSASRKKIKIPNICDDLGASFMEPAEMLRREGWEP